MLSKTTNNFFALDQETFESYSKRSAQFNKTLDTVHKVLVEKRNVSTVANEVGVTPKCVYDFVQRFRRYQYKKPEMTQERFDELTWYWHEQKNTFKLNACSLVLVHGWSVKRVAEHLQMKISTLQNLVSWVRKARPKPPNRRKKVAKPDPEHLQLTEEDLKRFLDNPYTMPLSQRTMDRVRFYHIDGYVLHQLAAMDNGLLSDIRTALKGFEKHYKRFLKLEKQPRDTAFERLLKAATRHARFTPRESEMVRLMLMTKDAEGNYLTSYPCQAQAVADRCELVGSSASKRVRQLVRQVLDVIEKRIKLMKDRDIDALAERGYPC